MINVQLRPGTRVRLRGQPEGVTLRVATGVVIGRARDDDGRYLVRLDTPAIAYHTDGSLGDRAEVREPRANLEVLPARGGAHPPRFLHRGTPTEVPTAHACRPASLGTHLPHRLAASTRRWARPRA